MTGKSKKKDKVKILEKVENEELLEIAQQAKEYGAREVEALHNPSDSDSESSSEEEDENGELLTPEMDIEIMRTIAAIRRKDPRVYQKDAVFYSEETIRAAEERWEALQAKKRREQSMTIQDFQRKVLLEDGGVVDEEAEMNKVAAGMTHVQEQQMIKDEFKSAIAKAFEQDDDEELFSKKEKTEAEKEQEDKEYREFILNALKEGGDDAKVLEALENIQGESGEKEGDAFLIDYILNRGWVDKGKSKSKPLDDVDLLEDERNVEANDYFESVYNFRFEEEGGTQLMHHSRRITDSVRAKDDSRKRERERRKALKEEKKKKKMEELKRLKNLKKKEIIEKLRQIKEITGNEGVGLDNLDGQFDPEEYDATMAALFNDEYYQQKDEKKPVFEDDIDITDIVQESDEEGKDKKKKKKKKKKKEKEKEKEEEFIMDADYLPGGEKYEAEASNDKANKISKKKLSEYLDEYYQLDYEDIVGDMPTRFKYRAVKPSTFGLTPEEILLADDALLNEHVSMKKLAPYLPEEVQERNERRYSKKRRVFEFRRKLHERLRAQAQEQYQSNPSSHDEHPRKKRKKTKSE